MFAHLQQIFWVLRVLWGLKIWVLDKFPLWQKTIKLYFSFLAFTDHSRPIDQLRQAMICALVSAIYDYETDQVRISRHRINQSHFFSLLENLIESEEARCIAKNLFKKDYANKLSRTGLERGGVALKFYNLVIGSKWMESYTDKEILYFGEMLQIVDDLIDLYSDYIHEDKNCFLDQAIAKEQAQKLEEFLESGFWQELKNNSWLYRFYEKKINKSLNHIGFGQAGFKEFFSASRPTTGIFAALLTIIGFKFYHEVSWLLISLTAIAFFGITASIMALNDLMDQNHDRKKGKYFASEHAKEFKRYNLFLGMVTGLVLVLIALFDFRVAIFCTAVWVIGLNYSLIIKFYLINQLVVALCSASPVLCGLISHFEMKTEIILIFLAFSSLIFINEIYKDIEDRKIDPGYKETMPTRLGYSLSGFYSIGLCYLPVIFLLLFPNPYIRAIAFLMVIIQFRQAFMLLEPKRVGKAKATMRFVLKTLLIALLVIS